jgi:hypothetical protein
VQQTGGVTVGIGNTVVLSIASTTGISSVRYEIYDYPADFALPASWLEDDSGIYYALTNGSPAPVVVADVWGKYLCRVKGRQGGETSYSLLDERTAFQIISPNLGLEDIGYRETDQFDARLQWVRPLKQALRVLDGMADGLAGPTISQWDSYSPTLTGTTDFPATIGTGTLDGRWRTVGLSAEIALYIRFASGTSFGMDMKISLPTPMSRADLPGGFIVDSSVYLSDASTAANNRGGIVRCTDSSSAVQIQPAGVATLIGSAVPFTWAVGDEIFVSFSYPI